MTLIARLTFKGIPVFVSDILLTTESKSSREVSIPSGININDSLTEKTSFKISGLKQKTLIIDDNLVLSWAGDYVLAHRVFKKISKNYFSEDFIQDKTRHNLLKGIDEEGLQDLSIIGAFSIPSSDGLNAHIKPFSVNSIVLAIEGVEVCVAGSGAKIFLAKCKEGINSAPPPTRQVDFKTAFNWLTGFASSLASSVFTLENPESENLLEAWGGGFEITHLTTGYKFIKMDDILHTLWFYHQNDGQPELEGLTKFLKINYIEDDLFIQSLNFKKDPRFGSKAIEERNVFIVHPMLKNTRNLIFDGLNLPNLDHKILSCTVIHNKFGETSSSKRIRTRTTFFGDAQNRNLISIKLDQNNLHVFQSDELKQTLLKNNKL